MREVSESENVTGWKDLPSGPYHRFSEVTQMMRVEGGILYRTVVSKEAREGVGIAVDMIFVPDRQAREIIIG